LRDRCINAVIVASEWVRAERKELRRQGQVSAEPGSKSMHGESAAASSAETQGDVEVAIKTAFTKFLQSSVATVLESWDDSHRLVVPIQKLGVLTSH
jgi:NCK-associated protein 1